MKPLSLMYLVVFTVVIGYTAVLVMSTRQVSDYIVLKMTFTLSVTTCPYHCQKLSRKLTLVILFQEKKIKKEKQTVLLFTYYKLKENSKVKLSLKARMYLGVYLTSCSCQDQGVLFHLHL